jgi:hypothetical protein
MLLRNRRWPRPHMHPDGTDLHVAQLYQNTSENKKMKAAYVDLTDEALNKGRLHNERLTKYCNSRQVNIYA